MPRSDAILFVVLLCSCITSVQALNPHVNITFHEFFNNNVTFAQNFTLEETSHDPSVNGILTIHNPGAETIFDIHVLITGSQAIEDEYINHAGGRIGYQYVTPKRLNVTANYTITSTFVDLGLDIDEDDINDSARVNSTHLIVNASSEYSLLAYRLQNTSGNADLSIPGQAFDTTINITSIRMDDNFNQGVVFATLTLQGSTTSPGQLNESELLVQLNDTFRPFMVIVVPELAAGESSIFHYGINGSMVPVPIDLRSSYLNPAFETKVLAGERFIVQSIVQNQIDVADVTDINLTFRSLGVPVWNGSDTLTFNFTLQNLSPTGDYSNVIGNGTDNRTWNWVVNGGTMTVNSTYNITYQIEAPATVPTSSTYPAVFVDLNYRLNATASRVYVAGVRARAEIDFQVSKQIVSPQDELLNRNATWRAVPEVGTYKNITYTLTRTSVWVTTSLDPNLITEGLQWNYTVGSEINQSTDWTGSQWLFNFTDGSSDSSPPPIVWIKPYWYITNTGGQIINSSVTTNGTDTYTKYIYVVNGYWLEVQKNITSVADDQYDVVVHVQNRGNGHTPQNLTVTVYDLVPAAFTMWNVSPGFNNYSNVSGAFDGAAYQWDVGLRTAALTSFSPRGDPDGHDTFTMTYSVNGSGDFRVTDLYIVGLDPRKVDNANAAEGVAVLAAVSSSRREYVYAGISVFLLLLNMGNYLVSRRSRKVIAPPPA